jgi:phage/plasmid-associated DNA primase
MTPQNRSMRAVNFKHWESDHSSELLVCIGSEASTKTASWFLEEQYKLAWINESQGKLPYTLFELRKLADSKQFNYLTGWSKNDDFNFPLEYKYHFNDDDNSEYRPPVVLKNSDIRNKNRLFLNMHQKSVKFLLIGKFPEELKKELILQLLKHRIEKAVIVTLNDSNLESENPLCIHDDLTEEIKYLYPEYWKDAGLENEYDEDKALPTRADNNIEFDKDTPDSFIRDYLRDQTTLLNGFSIDESKNFLFGWDGKKWNFCEDDDFKFHIDNMCLKPTMPEGYPNRRVSSVSEMCRRELSVTKLSKKNLINFQNCVMEISDSGTLTTSPHNKSFGLTTIADYSYIDGVIDTTYFDMWINHASCNSESEFSQERYDAIMAVCYFVITNQYQWQYFIEVVGDGGTGKSIFVKIIEALSGGFESVCYMSLSALEGGEGKGPLKGLIGKRVLIMPEQPQYYGGLEALKRLTGNDPFSIPIMNKADYVMPFFPGVVLSTSNQPIAATDKSSAIERRRVTVYMDNKVKDEDKIIGMSDLIKEEVPALFNKVTSYFNTPEAARQILNDYRNSDDKQKALIKADVLVNWITENLEPDNDCKVKIGSVMAYNEARKIYGRNSIQRLIDESKVSLYVNYRTWCHANDIVKSIAPRNFTDVLLQRLSQLSNLGFNNCEFKTPKNQRVITNIKIKTTSPMFCDLKEQFNKQI